MQSYIDDNFEELQAFAKNVYDNLVLLATKRQLLEEELYLLEVAAKVNEKLIIE